MKNNNDVIRAPPGPCQEGKGAFMKTHVFDSGCGMTGSFGINFCKR